ncbi:hypothetical protein EOD10_31380 [Mesorhizobium sp. M7A.T.Ca.TU.009.01.3.2]|jgi:hypothetical protein|nr:hypothetical protein EOD10_31380 [Mesorhizobium sp. M7A.T.Ca.TU.009.01.3.2]RUU96644.1 hypothetical protein EOD00_25235 [Mesorhizobium sp. M7A.T.Ca.TU.009.01.3.1]RUV52279.1 hypothetical protein EOB77_07350 [Mesorhizobium sp. M7A.F.Ca.MR.228.00.0.0]
MILQGAFKIVVQREPYLALVAARDDYLGHAIERSLNPVHGDWLKRGRISPQCFAFLQDQKCTMPNA